MIPHRTSILAIISIFLGLVAFRQHTFSLEVMPPKGLRTGVVFPAAASSPATPVEAKGSETPTTTEKRRSAAKPNEAAEKTASAETKQGASSTVLSRKRALQTSRPTSS